MIFFSFHSSETRRYWSNAIYALTIERMTIFSSHSVAITEQTMNYE